MYRMHVSNTIVSAWHSLNQIIYTHVVHVFIEDEADIGGKIKLLCKKRLLGL